MKLEPVQPLLPAGKTQIHASASTPLQFDAEAYIKRFMSLTKAGAGQCAQMPVQQAIPSIKKIVYPLPHFKTIPSIPLLLTAPQVEVIDTMRGKCQSATIASIFDCFSFHPTEERDKSSSKLLFVVNFLHNIRTSDFNFELAIVCQSSSSEAKLYKRLHAAGFKSNMRELSSFASFNNLYGVVIRFSRSNQAKDSVIVNPNVNLIFLYEPIMGPLPDIQQLHNGTNEVPRVFNLINMNSAEQNLCDRIEDKVELDPNRPISHIERGFLNNIFNHGVKFIPVGDPMLWNPHLADGLAQWIKRNRKEPYDPYYLPLPKNMSSKGRKVVCSSDISSWVDYSAIDTEANNGAFLRQPEVTSKTSTPHEMAAPIVAAAAAAERPSAPPTVAGSSVQKRALNKSDASVSETNKKPRIQEDATEEQNTVMVKSEEVKDTSLMETDEDQNTTTPNSFMANLDSIFEKALNQFELDLENIKVNI